MGPYLQVRTLGRGGVAQLRRKWADLTQVALYSNLNCKLQLQRQGFAQSGPWDRSDIDLLQLALQCNCNTTAMQLICNCNATAMHSQQQHRYLCIFVSLLIPGTFLEYSWNIPGYVKWLERYLYHNSNTSPLWAPTRPSLPSSSL